MLRRFFFLVLIYIFASGCSQTPTLKSISTLPSTIPTTFALPAITPSSTLLPTLVLSPTATSILPNLALTLTPFNQDERIIKLFQEPACNFPCWWNIKPGITTWNDAKSLFDFLGLPIEDKRIGLYTMRKSVIYSSEQIYKTSIEVYDRDGIVEYIAMKSAIPENEFKKLYNDYEPEKIFKKYGIPDRIFIFATNLGDTSSYSLDLYYDIQGVYISIGGSVNEITETEFVICSDFSISDFNGIGIYTKSPIIKLPFENSPIEGLSENFSLMKTYRTPIEEATGLTREEFIDLFIGDNPSYCFSVKK